MQALEQEKKLAEQAAALARQQATAVTSQASDAEGVQDRLQNELIESKFRINELEQQVKQLMESNSILAEENKAKASQIQV
jgi:hypothetical protein